MGKKNVIAPDGERAVVAMDKMQKEIEKVEELYGDGLPYDHSRLEIGIKARTAASINMMVQNGKDYHRLKAHLPHGEFLASVERTSGKSHVWVWQCMKMAEMAVTVPQILTEVNVLNTGQFRALTTFEKPVVEEYLKGGPLGDIPHDDVATMPRGELEDEARRLRKKEKTQKDAHEKEVSALKAEIEQLQNTIDYRTPLAGKEKSEKAAAAQLEDLRKKLFGEIQLARFHFGEAIGTVSAAQKVEGVNFAMLEKWAMEEYGELAGFNELFEELDEALKYCRPDKGDEE